MEAFLIPHPFLEGYYQSRRDTRVFVNKEGKVVSYNAEPLETYVATGYLTTLGGHVHRHVVETFHPRPLDIPKNKQIANHKDGNKMNNSKDNLEWTTYQGNLIHAITTSLNPCNVPVLVKDLRTGEFVEFYGIQQTARVFGMDAALVLHALKPKLRGKVWNKYYGIIRKGEDWPRYDENDIGKTLNGYARELVLWDLSTGKKERLGGFSMLASRLKKPKNLLSEWLRKKLKRNEIWVDVGDHKYTYADMYPEDDLEEIPLTPLEFKRPDLQNGFRKPWAVNAQNIQDGTSRKYASLRDCCLDLCLSHSYMQKKLAKSHSYEVGKWVLTYEK